MGQLRVDAHLVDLPVLFAGLRRNQVPFAAAAAITAVAQEAADALRSGLKQRFTVRNASLLQDGKRGSLRTIPANKRDWPALKGGVGVVDAWLARHEEGGPQKPLRGSTFAIPTRVVDRKRTAKGSIPKRQRPGRLLAEKRGRRVEETIINTAKKGSLKGNLVLYLLRRRIRLDPRLDGRHTVDRVARARFQRHFEGELTDALHNEFSRGGSLSRRARSSPGIGRLLGFA